MKSRVRRNHTSKEMGIITMIQDFQKDYANQFDDTGRRKEYYIWSFGDKDRLKARKCRRVGHCKAYLVPDSGVMYIQSYKTIIGMYDKIDKTYYSMGAYSMTTYQHERKALNMLNQLGYHIEHIVNLWVVDNFGSEV